MPIYCSVNLLDRQSIFNLGLKPGLQEGGHRVVCPDELKRRLGEFMPLDSIIIDLWDWDIHFESELCNDWFLSAAFGHTDTLDSCSADLADFFLEKVDEYGMNYDQPSDREGFEDWINKESMKFIENWRRNLAALDEKTLRGRGENSLQVGEKATATCRSPMIFQSKFN
jgi:hypothetical protein